MIWCQEECRNSVGTRMFLVDFLKQDVRTLLFLLYLLKVANSGSDMVVKRNVGTASERVCFFYIWSSRISDSYVFATCAQSA